MRFAIDNPAKIATATAAFDRHSAPRVSDEAHTRTIITAGPLVLPQEEACEKTTRPPRRKLDSGTDICNILHIHTRSPFERDCPVLPRGDARLRFV